MTPLISTTNAARGEVRVAWFDASKRAHHARASNAARMNQMAPGRRARKAPKYKGQLSYQGHYWFAGIERLVWHESMAEYAGLMLIDHMRSVRSVVAQPFVVRFADGTTHIPDYLVDNADRTRTVVDVHLRSLTSEEDEKKFAATQNLCDALGWEYLLLDRLLDVPAWNLETMARYRHPMFEPGADVRDRILASADATPEFGRLRRSLETGKVGELVPSIMHLMWRRELIFDIEKPFTDTTIISPV